MSSAVLGAQAHDWGTLLRHRPGQLSVKPVKLPAVAVRYVPRSEPPAYDTCGQLFHTAPMSDEARGCCGRRARRKGVRACKRRFVVPAAARQGRCGP